MGSYDRVPEDYDGPAPEHVIWCNSKWSYFPERHTHPTVELVRICATAARFEKAGAKVWPCSWDMEAMGEDGPYAVRCNLPTMFTDDRGSYECVGGHDHVPAEVRFEQGWDYAEDAGAAELLAKYGTEPRDMQGRPFLR